jgi:diguanylate cyclase (GGDEF)-like protein
LAALCIARHRSGAIGIWEIVLAGIAALGAVFTAIRCGRLERGVCGISFLVTEVRRGFEPVSAFSDFGGPVSGLALACHDLAHDLRMERWRTAKLQDEIRQRIANRTQALERTIGALRQQAAKDGLTGLFNRRSLDAYLPDAVERCGSAGAPLCVLMIDIDHFKPLNDTLGHAAGDQMLKSVAQIIRSTIRENDLAFRNGGDEFVVVLEECDEATGRVIAERLGALGDSLGRTFRLLPPPSLSVGLTMLSELKGPTAAALLRRADEVLYQVKAAHHAASGTTGPSRKSA